MCAAKKSYCVVRVGANGQLPVSIALVEKFGIREGDLAGVRKLPGGNWELTFWRQLHPNGYRRTKTSKLPDHVAMASFIAPQKSHHGNEIPIDHRPRRAKH